MLKINFEISFKIKKGSLSASFSFNAKIFYSIMILFVYVLSEEIMRIK
jgi:hypothetical protein